MKTSGHPSLLKVVLLLLMFVSYSDTYVFAKPRGGQVVSGNASFTQDGNLTVITAGNRSIINYQSFDIGKNETVRFVQPGAHATVLNRVTSLDPTNIFGTLQSNGIVVIANPYGVFFQNGSVINVGGLIAGAGKVSAADFTHGKVRFTDLNGDVRNDGVIAADNRIALMGANVANTGSMTSAHGVAMMVSGDEVYVGEKDGNVFVKANGRAVQAQTTRTGGASAGSVTNTGTVAAPRVLLGAGDMYSTAIVNSGLLQGRSIAVNAGKNGSATVGGTLDASGGARRAAGADRQGGRIDVLGGTVALKGATLDASGAAGGGSVRVGGDFHGAPTVAASTTTTVDAASTIKADATGPTGDGGTVVVWSGNSTAFSGNITARGGATGGNGGSVEVSSTNKLAYLGFSDLRASAGTTGNLLLDPANYVIDTDIVTNYGYPADTTLLTPAQLTVQLTASSVTLAADNDIVFRSDVTANVNANSLTLTAGHSIYIGDPGSNPLGATTPPPATSVTLTLGGNLTATYNSTGAVAGVTNARFRMAGTSAITTPGTVNISNGGVNLGNTPGIFAQNITTSVGTAGGTPGSIILSTSAGANEPITLNGPLAASGNGGVATNTNGGTVTLTASGAIVGGANTITANSTGNGVGGTIGLTASGALTVGDLSARGRSTGVGGSVTLKSSAATAGAAGAFTTGNIDVSAAGAVGGTIAIGAPAAAGNFLPTSLTVGTLTTAGNTATASTTTGGAINLQTSGLLTLTPAAPAFTGNTTLLAGTTNATSFAPGGYNFSLTLNGAAISTSQITGAVNNLALASPGVGFGVNIDGNVTSNGAQTYTGTTTVTAAGANVALTAGAVTANSNITFNNSLDDNVNGTHNLTLVPGSAGGTTLAAAVGTIHPLLSLTATTRTTGATTTTDQPVTVNGVSVATTGAQQYGSLTLGGAVGALTLLTGGNVTAGPVTANAQPLTVTASGTGTFGAITGAGDLIFNGAGATALNGAITATSLAVTGGTGVTVTLPAASAVTTTGQQNYGEALILGSPVTLTGQGTAANGGVALRFGAGMGGGFALTLSNTASGVGGVGSDTVFVAGNVNIASLSTSAVGTTQINNGGITTTAVAGQVFNGPVTLGATTALVANAAGVVNFANGTATLGSAGTPQALTITTTGATTFGAAVGGAPGAGGTAVTAAPALASLNITGGGTVNVNGGSVTTVTTAGGSQAYSGQVVIGANTTFKGNTATFTGGITSSGAAGNPFNLTLDLASQLTLPGLALTGIRDFASVGSGGVLLNGNVSTFGSQTYGGGGVVVAANTILQAGTGAAASNIVFNTTVQDQTNGAHTLTLNAGSSGGVTFNNPVGGGGLALASLTATTLTGGGVEPVTINGGTITTTGAQSYGTLTLGGAAGAQVSLVANGGGTGAITSGAVTGAGHPLLVSSTGATGTTTFSAITGAGAVDFEVGGTATFNGGITATSFTLGQTTVGTQGIFNAGGTAVQTTAGQTYNQPIFLGLDTTFTDTGSSAISFKAVNSVSATGRALTVNTSGATIFTNLVGSTNPLASVTTDLGGTTQINGGLITTNGAAGQVYHDDVTLGGNTILSATNNGAVTFDRTLESAGTGTARTLTITTGGATTFGGRVGGAPGGETTAVTTAPALANLNVAGGGVVNINGGSITTVTDPTGLQSYSGQVVLGADTVLKGFALTLSGGITSGAQAGNPFSLTLDLFGPVTLPGSLSLTGIRDFTSAGPGTVTINGNVTTTRNQTYRNGPVLIGANVTLTAGSTDATGSLVFNSTVNDQTAGLHTLTLVTGTSGGTTIGAAVGGLAPLLSLTATARQTTALPTTANQPVTINATGVTTTGAQNYGALVLGGSGLTTLGGSSVTSGPVTGNANPLTVNATGSTNFGAITGAGALNFNVAGTATFASINDAAPVTTTLGWAVFGPLTATGVSVGGTGTATFNGAVNAADVSVTETGATAFNATVNATSLTVTGGTSVTLNAGTITTTGQQNYNEPAILGSAETLTGRGTAANGGVAVRFGSTLTGTFALTLTNTASGVAGVGSDTVFGGAVGTLASLTASAVGTTQINGGSVVTNGAIGQVYNGAVTLGATTTLTAGTGPVNFVSTLDSAGAPRALTVNSALTTFGGLVGGTPPAPGTGVTAAPALASLTTTGTEVDIARGVTTVTSVGGFQNYGGAVRLTGTPITLKGYSLTLAAGGIIGQGNALTLDFVTQVALPNGIAGVGAFSTVGAGGALISGAFSAGSQSYSGGPVVLGAASTLTATGGNLTFNVPVDGAFALTLNATAAGGQAIFNSAALVGNGTTLGAFTSNTAAGTIFNVNAGSSTSGNGGVNAASVTVTGPVTFNEAGSTLAANTHPSILTTGAQTYPGAATLAQDTSLVSSGGGAISFNAAAATINSASATLRALNTSTTGLQTFTGLIGNTFALSGLTTGTGGTVFNMTLPSTDPNVVAAGVRVSGPVTTTGPVTFNVGNSSLTQPSVLTLGNGNQTYGTLTNPTSTVVTLAGPVTVLNSANTESPAGTFNGGGSITFNGNIVAGVAAPELDVRAGVGTVVFNQGIYTTGDFAPGGASVIFKGAIGTPANPLGTFTVLPNNGGGGTPLVDLNGGSVVTGGIQNYTTPVVLSADSILTAGTAGGPLRNITFGSTLDGSDLLTNNPYTLTINVNGGTLAFNGIVGGTVPLASLTIFNLAGAPLGTTQFNMTLPALASGLGGVNVLGPVLINTATDFEAVGSAAPTILSGVTYNSVAGTGTQTYNAAVTVGMNTVLRDLAAAGSITVNGQIDARVDGATGLSVNAVGDETFAGLVGSTNRLATLSTDDVGTVGGTANFTMDLTLAGTVAGVRTTGQVNVNDQVNFAATGGTTLPTILSGAAQNYARAATLTQNAVLAANAGNITFLGAVDSATTANPRALTVNTPGDEVFQALVGAARPLLSLTTDTGTVGGQTRFQFTLPGTGLGAGVGGVNTTGAVTLNDAVLFAVDGVTAAHPSVVSGGTQTYYGAATLGILTILTSTGGSIAFNSTVDSDTVATPRALTLNTLAAGSTGTFVRNVGSTFPLASLTSNGAGTTLLGTAATPAAGLTVTTTGAQGYFQPVTLGSIVTTTSLGAGDVTFNLAVNSDAPATPRALTVGTAGRTIFNGLVGTGNALASLTTLNVGSGDLGTFINGTRVVTVNNGTPGAPGTQTYNDRVTLGANTTLTSNFSGAATRGGDITFVRTLDSDAASTPRTLAINTAGRTVFGVAVGGINPLASLTTDNQGAADLGTFINGGSVTTVNTGAAGVTGAQIYNDAVTLGADATLASTVAGTATAGGAITFALTVNSDAAATPRNLAVNTTGTTTFGGAVGAANNLASVTTDAGGTTQLNGGSVTTVNTGAAGVTGAQTYNDAVFLGAATTLASNVGGSATAGGDIRFVTTLDSNTPATPQALTVNTSGTTTFGGAVGAANNLASVTTDAGGTTQLNGSSVTTVNTGAAGVTGAQTYNDAVFLGAATTLASNVGGAATAGGALTFNGTVDGGFDLTLNTSGLTVFNQAVGNATALTALTTNAAGSTQFNMPVGATAGVMVAGPVTINDPVSFNSQGASLARPTVLTLGNGVQTYNGAATLATSTYLVSATGPGTGGVYTGGGAILFNAAAGVSSVASPTPLDLFVRAGSGAGTIAGAITARDVDLGGALVNFAGPVNLSGTFSVQPNGGGAGGSLTFTGGTVTTTGAQLYNTALVLGANTVLASTGGNITFDARVDGAFNLAVNTPGDEVFNGPVGGQTPLLSLTTDAAGTVGGRVIFNFAGTTTAPSVTTVNAQTYNDAALLGANVTLASTAGGITFARTIDSATAATPRSLTLNAAGSETFNGVVGGANPLASLVTDDPAGTISGGQTIFNVAGGGPTVTTTDFQAYNDAVTLLAATNLTSLNNGALTFASTVNGAFALSLNTGGVTTFRGAVGNAAALASLTTQTGEVDLNGSTITTTGAQSYGGAVVLGADTTLTSTTAGGSILFGATLNSDGTPRALTISSVGPTRFAGVVGGGSPLGSLTTLGAGVVAINGGAITTTGAQNYGGAVTLGADTTLTSTAATGGITFAATLGSDALATPRALTISSVGPTRFQGVVGGNNLPLGSLTTLGAGAVAINGGAVTTTGTQNYGGAVTLGANTTLRSTTQSIVFNGTLNSDATATSRALTLDVASDETFGGAVGGAAPLSSLTTTSTGRVVFGIGGVALGVTTVGAQTYNNLAVLQAATTLTSTQSGTLTFASTVDSAANTPFALTLNTAGDEVFSASVGAAHPLLSLVTDGVGGAGLRGGNVYFGLQTPGQTLTVSTTGLQTYNDGVILRANLVFNSTRTAGDSGALTFASTVDSGKGDFYTLALNTPGDEIFGGLVGSGKELGGLTTDGGITPGGRAQFNMAAANGQNGVNVRGTVVINDAVRFSPSGAGVNSVTILSTGSQTFNGAAAVAANTVLSTTGTGANGAISFNSTLAGPAGLTLNTGGRTTFNGAIGGGGDPRLGSLAVNGGGAVALNAGVVNTTGAQSYSGAVTLLQDTAFSNTGGDITFAGTVGGAFKLTLTTANDASSTVFQDAVDVATFLANDGSNVVLAGANVTTNGLQTYGGTLTVTAPGSDGNRTVLQAPATNGGDRAQNGIIFKQDVNVQAGSLVALAYRILAGRQSDMVVNGGDLVLNASNLLVLQGSNYQASGRVILNDAVDPSYTYAAYVNGERSQPSPTIFVLNAGRTTTFRGSAFDMGYLQNLFSTGSVSITALGGGNARLSDIATAGSLSVTAGSITLRARDPDPTRANGTDDGLNFVAGGSVNFGQSPINYTSSGSGSTNNHANIVTPTGQVTVNRNQTNGVSLFQDPTVRTRFSTAEAIGFRFDSADNVSNLFGDFGSFLQLTSSGSKTQEIAAALSGALPDQKPLDVATDLTVTASQMEELKKLGIHPRTAQKQERLSLSSKRALFAQLVDGLDKENYGRLQPIKGGISTLVPSDYVVVVDRMSEREVQAILTAFEELYGKNKEKAPPIGEAFNTAFTDYSTEKQTADAAGFAPYIAGKPGKYPDVDKAVRGFDNLFGYIESLGLTPKEQEKSKEHIASDLQVSGVSPEDMVKAIDTLRSKIPKEQKAPSTKLPPSPPVSNPAPGATNPPPPEKKKGTPPLKTAREEQPGRKGRTVGQPRPAVGEDRLREVARL